MHRSLLVAVLTSFVCFSNVLGQGNTDPREPSNYRGWQLGEFNHGNVRSGILAKGQPVFGQPTLISSDFTFTLTTPLPLLYLEQEVVRTELKLNKDQIAKVDATLRNWADASKTIDLERGIGADGNPSVLIRKKLDEVLSVTQMKRLDQIILRHREKAFGRSAVLCMIAVDLKLSADQQDRFDVLRRKRAERVLEYLTSGERSNTIRRDVHEANTEFVEAIEKMLTKDQQTRIADMLGEPFQHDIKLREPLAVAFNGFSERSVYLSQLWGRYALEAEILNNGSVHKELKMNDDQIRKAKEFNVEWWVQLEKRRQEGAREVDAIDGFRGFFVGDELNRILTKEQRDRFTQIAMQYRKNIAGEAAALGFPRSGTELTRDQIERLTSGENVEKVLEPKQLADFRASLGPKFEGELTIVSPLKIKQTAQISKPNVLVPLLDSNRVTLAKFMLENSRRYRLDEDQVARLRAIDEDLPKLRQLLHRELSQLPPSTDAGAARAMMPEAKAVEHFRKSIFEQCFDVFDKKQQSLWGPEIRQAKASIIDY